MESMYRDFTKKMRCNCGTPSPETREKGPFLAPRKPVNWTFSGADDGIRTRDPNLGKVIGCNSTYLRICQKVQHERHFGLTTVHRYKPIVNGACVFCGSQKSLNPVPRAPRDSWHCHRD